MHKVPLPPELVEHFGHMQANCMIGLFPEIERAWLTIDSDIYVWRFQDCQVSNAILTTANSNRVIIFLRASMKICC